MKKVLIVLGCLLFSSQVCAEEIDCAKVKQVATSQYLANEWFWKQGEQSAANEKWKDAKEAFASADEAAEKSAHWATIYLAFCKD